MKIAINTLSFRATGGGITYIREILSRFRETDHKYIVFVPPNRDILRDIPGKKIEFREVGTSMSSIPALIFYEQLLIPSLVWREGIDVLYSPVDIAPLLSPCPVVLMIHNPNPYFINDFHTNSQKLKFRLQRALTKISVKKSDRVIFVSEFSKDIIGTKLGVPDQKRQAILHGIDSNPFRDGEVDQSVNNRIRELSPFILTVSTVHRHKNYEVLLEGYANVSRKIKEKYPLVIVGRIADKEYFQELNDSFSFIGKDVHFLGGIPSGSLEYAYGNAKVYAFPSKLETFGMTLLEAMNYSIPIIASNSTAIPEIVEDAALYFSPDDPQEFTTKLTRILEDDALADQLIESGIERLDHFSWDQNVEQLVTAFENVAEEK